MLPFHLLRRTLTVGRVLVCYYLRCLTPLWLWYRLLRRLTPPPVLFPGLCVYLPHSGLLMVCFLAPRWFCGLLRRIHSLLRLLVLYHLLSLLALLVLATHLHHHVLPKQVLAPPYPPDHPPRRPHYLPVMVLMLLVRHLRRLRVVWTLVPLWLRRCLLRDLHSPLALMVLLVCPLGRRLFMV